MILKNITFSAIVVVAIECTGLRTSHCASVVLMVHVQLVYHQASVCQQALLMWYN